jgi:plastocyanin
VTVKTGQAVKIIFKNVGATVHNLIVEAKSAAGKDFQTDIAVLAGAQSTFEVRIDKPGTYNMQCTISSRDERRDAGRAIATSGYSSPASL